MIRSKTVLVLGAGASCEFDFPSGVTLLQQISKMLHMTFDVGHQKQGSHSILEAYRALSRDSGGRISIQEYVNAGRRLAQAADVARSIDNAIDQNDQNELVVIAGKLAIAQAIVNAEASSKIKKAERDFLVPVRDLNDTWLHPFFQMLTTDVKGAAVDRIFDNLTIISFNYDRAFEVSLPAALVAAYGMGVAEAEALANRLPIYHPYGSIGRLDWQTSVDTPVPFGTLGRNGLLSVAAGIKTFTEKMETGAELDAIKKAMREAQQIVFLGFGYHGQNMRLLEVADGWQARRVLGTVYEEPAPAIASINRQLVARGMVFGGYALEPSLTNCKCNVFMREYFRPLTE